MTKPPKSSDKPDEPLVEDVKDAIEDAVVLNESADESELPEGDEAPQDEASTDDAPDMPEDPPQPVPPGALAKHRGGVGVGLGLILGGLVAALIGFTAARTIVPEGWPFPGVEPEVDPLVAVIEAQEARTAALEAQVETLSAGIDALKSDDSLSTLRDEIGQKIAENAEASTSRFDDLAARIAKIEKTAPGGGTEAAEAAAAAYERELAEIRAMVDAELADLRVVQEKAEALEQDAAEAAQDAAGRAALAQVLAALDTGQPFAAALDDMSSITGKAAPEALADVASDGAPTLAMLQGAFPDAARAALDASIRAAVENGSMNRFTAFLRTQLGTRSLEPKAGDDPDAILSRAEDALRKGQIADALGELDAMPEAARPALADWRAMAETRLSALTAGADLADALK